MDMECIVWENMAGWCVLGWKDVGIRYFQFGYRSAGAAKKTAAKNGAEIIPINRAPEHAWMTKDELDRYFRGEKTPLKCRLDWSGSTEFQRAVWGATMKIPYGETRTYTEIARATGSPGATRAAGTALGANPIPVIVPCHRVLRANGEMGGFSTGVNVKQALLELEKGRTADLCNIRFERK